MAKKSVANSGRPSSWAKANQGLDSNHLNLVVLGSDNLTGTLERQVKSLCNSDDEFLHQDEIFSLDYRCVSGDVSLPENAFRTQDFLPHGKTYFLKDCLISDTPGVVQIISDENARALVSTVFMN